MKKTLLTAMVALTGLCAHAQLPNGTMAPDFTATDINGVQHHLYEYLNAGKTVIIDVSATWCGPCWSYHGTDALADLHDSYGMGGSEEVVVLFIEGDPGTSVESIYGTNTDEDTSTTRGDWTAHSPYPIIDDGDGSISEAYQIGFFPTVYMICPSGVTTQLTQPSAATLRNRINTNCADPDMTGLSSKAAFRDITAGHYCEANGIYKAKIKNFGSTPITSATLAIKENGTVVTTKDYSRPTGLNQYASAVITFDSATFTANTQHTVEITSINGAAPAPADYLVEAIDIQPFHAVPSERSIEVRLYTDYYPNETSWRLTSSAGVLIASGGPYRTGTAANGGGGSADANTVISTFVTLPAADDCYKIELRDSYGDGMTYSVSPEEVHGIEVFNGETSVYQNFVSSFGSSLMMDAAIKTVTVAAVPDVLAKQFAVYPNPTTGVLNFTTSEAIDVTVTDLTGKTVYNAKGILNGGSINLGGLQTGMYIAQIKGATIQTTQKIIIE